MQDTKTANPIRGKNASSKLESLSPDITFHIATFLPISDIPSVQLTSHALRQKTLLDKDTLLEKFGCKQGAAAQEDKPAQPPPEPAGPSSQELTKILSDITGAIENEITAGKLTPEQAKELEQIYKFLLEFAPYARHNLHYYPGITYVDRSAPFVVPEHAFNKDDPISKHLLTFYHIMRGNAGDSYKKRLTEILVYICKEKNSALAANVMASQYLRNTLPAEERVFLEESPQPKWKRRLYGLAKGLKSSFVFCVICGVPWEFIAILTTGSFMWWDFLIMPAFGYGVIVFIRLLQLVEHSVRFRENFWPYLLRSIFSPFICFYRVAFLNYTFMADAQRITNPNEDCSMPYIFQTNFILAPSSLLNERYFPHTVAQTASRFLERQENLRLVEIDPTYNQLTSQLGTNKEGNPLQNEESMGLNDESRSLELPLLAPKPSNRSSDPIDPPTGQGETILFDRPTHV